MKLFFCSLCRSNTNSTLCTFCQSYISKNCLHMCDSYVYLYKHPLRQIFRSAKFQHSIVDRAWLFTACEKYLDTYDSHFMSFDYITAIPSPWQRRISKGKELSMHFAEIFARKLNLPLYRLLSTKAYRPSRHQRMTSKKKYCETKDFFKLKCSEQLIKNKSILLIDDVCTTGESLEAAKNILNTYDCQVHTWSFAYTPRLDTEI